MFAVIKTGGKQYRVEPGDRFTVEKLAAEAGDTVQFNEVLLLGGSTVTVGTPLVAGAAVQASVIEQTRGDKLINFKRRRRKASSKRLKGHRQQLTLVEITEILAKDAGKGGVGAAIGARAARRSGVAAAPEAKARSDAKKAKAAPATKAGKAAPEEKASKAKAEKPAAKPDDTAPATAKPANLLEQAKGEPDDLTKLSGVGPKLQEKLNANGVFHFWQIAEWTPEEVAHMDEQLSFKGRIARDDWIGQAKTFAAEAGEK